ncbi:MAG TPA: hypothetical protein VFI78_03145, partial [Salinimicrobium sp.]|nr:hypothetical protein [Salinimicrobium sp.]
NLFFTIVLSIELLGVSSCSGDDDEVDETNNACFDFKVEVKEYSDALMAYSQNPSPETCENYKNALKAFAQEYKDCSLWTDSYQEALDNIDNFDCSSAE